MHTVDAASEYKRRLSCYYPPSMEMGGYAGNEFMVKTKKAIKVSDTEDLIKLFSLMEKAIRYHIKSDINNRN